MPIEKKSFIYLSRSTLEGLGITTEQAIGRLEKLILDSRDLDSSDLDNNSKSVWSAPKAAISTHDGRYMMATLSASDDPQLLAVKSLIVNPRNPQRGLDSINATITLLDSDTGLPVAVMDGNWVTAVRTACASAIAAKRLANEDARSIAFIGCGVQAHSHLKVFCDLFPIEEIRAFGRGSKNRDALCATAQGMGLNAIASDTPQRAVEDADIIVTSISISSTDDPFIDARWLKPGAFAAVTDLAIPWMDASMTAFDRIVIDDLAQEMAMPKPMVDTQLVQGDITGLVSNTVEGRQHHNERCAFVFRAVVLGDLALASLAYERASDTSSGRAIDTA